MTAITKDEAKTLVERAAFTTGEGRRVVHCFLGPFGADWDLVAVVKVIDDGAACAMVLSDAHAHNLHVLADQRIYAFDVHD